MRLGTLAVLLSTLMVGCGDEDRPALECDPFGDRPACYGSADIDLFCYVSELRDAFVAGEFTAAELPGWADDRLVDGAPLVFDLASLPEDSASVIDRLERWRASTDVPRPSREERADCADGATHADIVDLYGEPQG